MRTVLLLIMAAASAVPSRALAQGDEGRTADSVRPAPRGQNGPSQASDAQALQAALRELSREPPVQRVVQAAMAATPRGGSRALARRARQAGWVPRLSLRARRGQAVDLSSAQDGQSLKLSTDDDLTLEASLTFELDRVVFRREEVTLERQAQAERRARRALVREVVELYFERRRLQLEQRLHGVTAARTVRIAELEAVLDIFTDGAFRRMIADAWKTGASTPATRPMSSPSSISKTTP